jgi:competence protein ComEA
MRRIVVNLVLWLLPLALWAAMPLKKFSEVQLVDHPANDGDSFVVMMGGERHNLRLYFVDCPESVATTDADAKRVREQARYFGITDAKRVFHYGKEATEFTKRVLAEPFTVHTAFASALGRAPGGRIYAFVITADGKDLGRLLVENGLGRAYGTKREGPAGESKESIQRELETLEAESMAARRGTWAASDPAVIDDLRAEQRREDAELKSLLRESAGKKELTGPVDINTATVQELQAISGVGPGLSARIVAGRPYHSVDDLLKVSGIGPKLLDRIRPFIVVTDPPS